MKIKGIIFDKDGTLIDFDGFWSTIAYVVVDNIVEKLSITAPKDELLLSIGVENGVSSINGELCAGTYESIAKSFFEVAKKYGFEGEFSSFYKVVMDAFNENFDKGILKPTCDNLVDTLKKLREMGIKLFVVTTDNKFYTEGCLSRLGIREFFDSLYTDDGDIPTKPNPKVIELILGKENLKREELLMVGDTLTDMRFAKNGKIKAVGVAKTEENKKVLYSMTDIVIKDVSNIFSVIE